MSLLSELAKSSVPLRILISSRQIPELELQFSELPSSMSLAEISVAQLEDIRNYALSNFKRLRCEEKEFIARRLGSISNRNFLVRS